MPNGGVPIHMILYPKASPAYVIYARAGILRVYDRSAWREQKSQAAPLLELNDAEGGALAWFLKYWLGEATIRPGYDMQDRINAEFDF